MSALFQIQSRFRQPPSGSPVGWLDCKTIPPVPFAEANELLRWFAGEISAFEYRAVCAFADVVAPGVLGLGLSQ